MRSHKLLLFCVVVITLSLSSVSHGAIYYINDGGETNAAGSTFATAGSWATGSGATYTAYGTDYTYSNGGSATGTFTLQGIPTADYYVYAGWSPPNNPASRTPDGTITVTGTSGSIVAYPVNHEKHVDGSAGVDLTGSGFFPVQSGPVYQPITLGAGSTIVYTEGATPGDDRVSADVVVVSTDMLIDDISTLTTATAAYGVNWNQYTNQLGEYSYGYHTAAAPTSSDIFTYNLGTALGSPQAKELKVSWVGTSSRDQNVTYRVTHAGGVTDVAVDQRQDASGATISGVAWSDFRSLGAFQFDASSKLEVVPSGTGLVAVDTIALGHSVRRNRPGIVADFDDLNTSAGVDGYPGTAGKGWASAWSSNNANISMDVTTFNPIEGPDDPYLTVTASGSGDHAIRRQYQAYEGLDPGKPHHITWKWRFDGDMADMDSFTDRIHFFGEDDPGGGTQAGVSWLISWTDASGTGYSVPDRQWWFYDSMKSGSFNNGYTGTNMLPTGIGLEADTVYTFDVELFPETGTYNATIWSDAGSFAAQGLTFRNGTPGAYDWLHFGGASSTNSDWAFAFDSLEMYVPEPSALGLLILGIPALFFGRQSRRGRRRSA